MIVQSRPTRDELILANRRLVSHTIKSLWGISDVRAMGWDEVEGVALAALVSAADLYDPDRGAFSGLAFRKMRSAIIDHLRREKRWTRPQRLEHPERLIGDSTHHGRHDNILWVGSVLEKLDPADRQIIRRRFGVDGCAAESPTEIAEADGVTTRTVRYRLRQALQRARTALGPTQP